MKISKSIILPEFESIESLEQAGDILHKITEAMKDHQIQNYDDAIANYRRITTGRIQSQDGETYFDLDSGVIKGEIVFRKGSSGLGNIEEASPNDWDNAFRLANAVCGDSDFTLISGGKIITGSIAVGAFNSDVVARMFSSGASQDAIEAWMKAGHITYIDGAKIYAASITLSGAGGAAADFNYSSLGGEKPPTDADHTADIVSAMAYEATVEYAKLGTTIIDGGYIKTSLLTASHIRTGYLQTVQFRCGGGTDEDILFEDSDIRMYDAHDGNYRRIYWKYSTVDFARLSYKSDVGHSWFYLVSGSYQLRLSQQGNIGQLRTETGIKIQLGAGSEELQVYTTGQVNIPNKAVAPTSNNYYGQLIFDWEGASGKLHVYTTAWRHVNSSAGW